MELADLLREELDVEVTGSDLRWRSPGRATCWGSDVTTATLRERQSGEWRGCPGRVRKRPFDAQSTSHDRTIPKRLSTGVLATRSPTTPGNHTTRSHTVGCNFVERFGTLGYRNVPCAYSRQYQAGWDAQ